MRIPVTVMLLALSLPLVADEIRIPVGQQGADRQLVLPHNGMSKESVAAAFGEPSGKNPAVGSPPISSWIYADFTVYFEGNRVLHAVVNPPARQTEEKTTDEATSQDSGS